MEFVTLPLLILIIFILYFKVYKDFFTYKSVIPSSWGLLISLLMYGIFPVGYLLSVFEGSWPFSYLKLIDKSFFFASNALVFMFFLLYLLFYTIKIPFFCFEISNKNNNSFIFIFIVIFIVATCFYLLYVKSYGGWEYVLNNISSIRSGRDQNKNYLGAFFKMFGYYYNFLYYALLCYILGRYNKFSLTVKIFSVVLFLLFLLFIVFKSILDGGRGALIFVFVGSMFCCFIYGKKISIIHLSLLLFLMLSVILFGKTHIFQLYKSSSASFDFKEISYYLIKIFKEFSYPYLSLVNSLYQDEAGSRFFVDLISWIFKPFKLLGFDVVDAVSYYNTYLIIGKWDSMIPPGVIAFWFQQGGIFSIPFGALIVALIFKVLDKTYLYSIKSKDPFVCSYCIFIVYWFSNIFNSCDIALIIQNFTVFIILLFLLCVSGIFKVKLKLLYI
ncbi:O-antigen polymerase [Zooshikella ganghwensis]|uniref:Oligosaccharide repeat unit polymerase n=1 Tax=Zooshikella ganghwensis TaxID=202772 RepID=A0A4P9VIY0_9GAMM|nr:O-antigen polymerase [Zooshikella ganghwensis]RDH43208.1 oligosaccharide repeat unit polymerase [Zooshikella ganghwensis]